MVTKLEAGIVREIWPLLGIRSANCTYFWVPLVTKTWKEETFRPAGMVMVVGWLLVSMLVKTMVSRLSSGWL
jgi:hypothetical protein